MDTLLAIAARALMAQIFIISGWSKAMSLAATEGYFSSLGIPMAGVVAPLVVLLELGGGLALLFGFRTRAVAAVIALFSVGSALIAHTNFSDQSQAINFMKNLAMAGGLLMFVRHGAGAASIDAALESRRRGSGPA